MGNAEKPKIAIVSPYFDILGGGERFLLTIAEFFSKKSQVFLFGFESKLVSQAKERLGIDLNGIRIREIPSSSISFLVKLRGFDSLFYMTDGSLFFTPCVKNYLIIQSPAHIPKKNFKNMVKLSRFTSILCYSKYVQTFIKSRLNKNALVVPPPVLVNKFKPGKKENVILSVGRFFPWIHSKKQEVLVAAFKKLYRNPQFKNWRLVLIGSVDKGAEQYFNEIKKEAQGFPVEIIPKASLELLSQYYAKAKIYWHAAGFGEDLVKHPERAEHFGITTVEAMSAGCVPIVFAAGGQKEIVKERLNGFLWNQIAELVKKTEELSINEDRFSILSKKAHQDSLAYSKDKFIQRIRKIISND